MKDIITKTTKNGGTRYYFTDENGKLKAISAAKVEQMERDARDEAIRQKSRDFVNRLFDEYESATGIAQVENGFTASILRYAVADCHCVRVSRNYANVDDAINAILFYKEHNDKRTFQGEVTTPNPKEEWDPTVYFTINNFYRRKDGEYTDAYYSLFTAVSTEAQELAIDAEIELANKADATVNVEDYAVSLEAQIISIGAEMDNADAEELKHSELKLLKMNLAEAREQITALEKNPDHDPEELAAAYQWQQDTLTEIKMLLAKFPELVNNDFDTKLAVLTAARNQAKTRSDQIEAQFKRANEELTKAHNALADLLYEYARRLTAKLQNITPTGRMKLRNARGSTFRCSNFENIFTDAYIDGTFTISHWSGRLIERYDNHKQAETVIERLKTAGERGDTEFTFPIELNGQGTCERISA